MPPVRVLSLLSRLVCRSPRRPLVSSSKFAALLLTAAASLVLAGSASAQEFKVTATGFITNVSSPNFAFDSSVAFGTPFTYTYLFDYSTPGVAGTYTVTGANAGATATFGNYVFSPSGNTLSQIIVKDNIPSVGEGGGGFSDSLTLTSAAEKVTGLDQFSSIGAKTELQVFSGSDSFLSSDALPPLSAYAIQPTQSPVFNASVEDFSGNETRVTGQVTSLSAELVNPVPEASTVISLGVMLGLGGLALAVRRRRTAATR